MSERKQKFRVGQRVYWIAGNTIVVVGKLTGAGFISKNGWAFSSYEVRPLTKQEAMTSHPDEQARLASILAAPMRCTRCWKVSLLVECEPCIAPDGGEGTGFGCPVEDCGGIMVEVERANGR